MGASHGSLGGNAHRSVSVFFHDASRCAVIGSERSSYLSQRHVRSQERVLAFPLHDLPHPDAFRLIRISLDERTGIERILRHTFGSRWVWSISLRVGPTARDRA